MDPPQATISSVGPNSTTAALAANVPKEDGGSSELPGTFPETPAAENQEFRVNPIPGTGTGINPITTRPGERVPQSSDFTNRTIESNVTLDKESYDKAGGVPQLPNPITPAEERGTGMFGLPEITKNMIPESSLPVVGGAGNGAGTGAVTDTGPTIQSVSSQSTTNELAGKVPIEPRGIPEVVSESQEEANVSPEASANPEAVQEKSAVEQELVKKVPEESATSESTISGKAAAVATGAATGAAAAASGVAAYTSSGQATEDVKAKLPASAKETLNKANGAAKQATPIAPTVPDVVQESIAEAHQTPEAAASKTAVEEKSAVESELLKMVKTEEGTGEPAPTITAATTEEAPRPMMKSTETPLAATSAPSASTDKTATPAAENSIPVVAAAPSTVATPAKPSNSTPQDSGLAAPASAPATTPAAKQGMGNRQESRDISPMTRTGGDQQQPSVTTGVASSSTPTKSTPAAAAAAPGSPMSTTTNDSSEGKKSKRKSGFFGKLKEKFEHRKDKN